MKTISLSMLVTVGAVFATACAHNDNPPPSTAATYASPDDSSVANTMPDSNATTRAQTGAGTVTQPTTTTPATGTTNASGSTAAGGPAPSTATQDVHAGTGASGATDTATPSPATGPGSSDPNARPDADNTRVNARDKNGGKPTPIDQGNGKDDIRITADIRKSVVGDSALSFTAKNVKIITNGGRVVLRGPVKTAEERANIEAKARATAGVTDVDNQLEIKK